MNEGFLLTIPSVPLPYYLESGKTRYAPGEQHPSRRSIGVYDLIVVETGHLYMGEESARWEVGPGQSLLLGPDRFHYPVRPCDEETRFYWLHFQTAGPSAEGSLRYAIRLPQHWTLPFPAQTFRQFERLLLLSTERRSEAFWEEQFVFQELIRQMDGSRTSREGSRTLAVAELVESYIKRNYAMPINNDKLSSEFHFHHNYLIRCMKEAYGVSPLEYLLTIRLEQAKRLLIKTDWSVARIAEEVGFGHASYFSRCFSAHNNGVSPLQYRKRYSQ